MAVDKLVDSAQLDSGLTQVANAIRTKGGTSESLAFPSGFVSAIEAIPSGGGLLPTSISKIAGGSFTLSSTSTASTYSISHDMGVTPIGFVVWCNTIDVTTEANGSIVRFAFFESFYNNNYLEARQYQVSAKSGSLSPYADIIIESRVSGFVSSNFVKVNIGNIAYSAGHEYKWLAWA